MSNISGRKFKCRNFGTTCDAKWVIYCILCPICNAQYVGQTNNFRFRMNAHKSELAKCVNDNLNPNLCTELYKHLRDHSPCFFYVQILDLISSSCSDRDDVLNRKEKEWIWKLDCVYPKGLNINDGFNCQNSKRRSQNT